MLSFCFANKTKIVDFVLETKEFCPPLFYVFSFSLLGWALIGYWSSLSTRPRAKQNQPGS